MRKVLLFVLVLIFSFEAYARKGVIRRVIIDDLHTLFFDRKETREVVATIGDLLAREGGGSSVDFYDVHNYISDEEVRELSPFLAALPYLRAINFSWNRISDEGAEESLVQLLCKDSIEYVVLTGNGLGLSGIPAVFQAIQRTKGDGEDMQALNKLIWVLESHLGDVDRPTRFIPQEMIDAHRRFYASQYARQLKKCGTKWD